MSRVRIYFHREVGIVYFHIDDLGFSFVVVVARVVVIATGIANSKMVFRMVLKVGRNGACTDGEQLGIGRIAGRGMA